MTAIGERGTRTPQAGPADDLAARLKVLARSDDGGTRGARVLSATVAAPEMDAAALFASARAAGLSPALWIQPRDSFALVGIGEAWAVEPTASVGPDRFSAADAAWRELAAGARVADGGGPARGTGPILIGGFAFDPAGGLDAAWHGFGPGRLALPDLLWTRTAGSTWLTGNVVVGEGAGPSAGATDPGARADALGPRWASVADAADGPVEGRRGRLREVGGSPTAEEWRAIVGRYAGAVGRGRVDKVVLARRVDLVGEAPVDVAGAIARLVKVAPESTIFAIARGDAVFLGATPERLVRAEGRDARTVAIAGTAARGRDAAEDEVLAAELLASEKEREEHEVVVRMLRDSLAPLCEALDIAPAPRVIRLRTVQHLCTDVIARTSDRAGILSLVGVLHPTPAVGGQPRAAALDLIRDQERIDRGWYAAPLGWVDRDGDGEFVVALRSGVVRDAHASLFAGCGIVADSDPDREWQESRIKLRALGGALGEVAL